MYTKNLEEKRGIVREYIRKNPTCIYRDIRKDTKLKVERIYKNMEEAYRDAGVKAPRTLVRYPKEKRREMIINYIKKNSKTTLTKLQKDLNIKVKYVFGGIKDAFNAAKVEYPIRDVKFINYNNKLVLSEVVGVFLGDGCFHITKNNHYHLFICADKREISYVEYLKSLFLEIYKDYKFRIYWDTDQIRLINCSKGVGNHLIKYGIIPGNKVKNKVRFPRWVWDKKLYLIGILRGLFDTDGCVYRKYDKYLQIQYKFSNLELVKDIREALIKIGFNPSKIQKEINHKKYIHWKLYLCRQKEIDKFMNTIKPKNNKHWQRYYNIRGYSITRLV